MAVPTSPTVTRGVWGIQRLLSRKSGRTRGPMHPVETPAARLPFGDWIADLPGKLKQSSDAALAVGVLVMIALMIIPVRPWLLDIFLTLNLAIGAILLMSSVLTPAG